MRPIIFQALISSAMKFNNSLAIESQCLLIKLFSLIGKINICESGYIYIFFANRKQNYRQWQPLQSTTAATSFDGFITSCSLCATDVHLMLRH